MIAFDQLYTARFGSNDDTVIRCGGADNRCRDQLAYVDTWEHGVRMLFFEAGWHVSYPDDDLLLGWLRNADSVFQYLQVNPPIWQRSEHTRDRRRFARRPAPVKALPNGGPHSGGLRHPQHFPALAICWYGHVNVLDAKRLRVR